MKRYAIILGCDEYKNYSNINYCHKDVDLMEKTLVEYCDYAEQDILVEYLTPYINKTPKEIIDDIKELLDKSESGDTILFYYAGHGDFKDGEPYIILPNTEPNNFEQTALPLRDISSLMRKDNRVNVRIFDTCHSGADVRGNNNNKFHETISSNSDGWVTFASCKGNEVSYPDSTLEHGVFTYYFCEAIKEFNEGEFIQPESLKVKVCDKVSEWCDNNAKIQTPTYNSSISGNINIARRVNKNKIEISIKEKSEEVKEKTLEEEMESIRKIPLVNSIEGINKLTKYIDLIKEKFLEKKSEIKFISKEIDILDSDIIDNIDEKNKKPFVKILNNNNLKSLHDYSIERIYEEEDEDENSYFYGLVNPLRNYFNSKPKVKEVIYRLNQSSKMPNSYFKIYIDGDGYFPDSEITIYLCPLFLRSVILFNIAIKNYTNWNNYIGDPIYLNMDESDNKKIEKAIGEVINKFNTKYEKVVNEYLNYYKEELSK